MLDQKQKEITKQKLEMWRAQLVKLEAELKEIFHRKGEAAKEGDLRENAAYQMAAEDAETWTARINDVKRMVQKLEKELKELK